MNEEVKDKIEKDFFEVIGANDMSDEEKGALFAKMMEVVQGRTIIRLGEEMSEEDRAKLEELIGAGNDEEAEKFIYEKSPNFDTYFEEEAKKLRQELTINSAE